MTLSRALEEAFASGDEEAVIVDTLEIDHPSLDEPLRLVRSVDGSVGDPGETFALPLTQGGERVPHLACAFNVIRPGADHDGPTDGKVQIDNVSDLLHDLLVGLIGYDAPVVVAFRQYRVLSGRLDAVTGPDDDTISGLEMTAIDLTADRAEGSIAWPDGRLQNVPTGPNAFFSRSDYPGLFS